MLQSLRTRLTAACIAIVVLSLAALAVANVVTARRSTLASLEASLAQAADANADGIGRWVQSRKQVVGSMKVALGQPDATPFLQAAKQAGGFDTAYIGRADKRLLSLSEVPAGFDPTSRPWYQRAAVADGPVLTAPYLDVTSHKLVVTFAEAIRADGVIAAVAGADVSLDAVVGIIAAIRPTRSSFAFLVTGDGRIATHPDPALALKPATEIDAALDAASLASLAQGAGTIERRIGGRAALLSARAIVGSPGTELEFAL